MATSKPRVMVTLDQDVYEILREFCFLSKRSMSSFLSESASDATPILSQLIPVLRVTAQMNDSTKDAVAAAMNNLKSGLDDQLGVLLSADSAPALHRQSDDSKAESVEGEGLAPFLLTRGSVNQSMHQNGEKPLLWLASSSRGEE